MRTRLHRYAVAGLSTLSIIGASVLAHGSASGSPIGGRQLTFTSTTAEPSKLFEPDPQSCNPATARCLVPYAASDTVTGDVTGVTVSAGTLSIDLTTGIGDAVTIAELRGTVKGCPGEGTALLRFIGRL